MADKLKTLYSQALTRHIRDGGEAPLQEAYELGRRSIKESLSILEMVNLHHAALTEIGHRDFKDRLPDEAIAKAGEFFAECMSSFEMRYRSVGDANLALHRMNETLEEEVRNIALALHDDAGQLMVAAHICLDHALIGLPAANQEQLKELKSLLSKVDDRIRDLSRELRPAMLEHLGLVPALEFLASSFGERSGLKITVESILNLRLSPPMATAIYRSVLEALANVRRHANASKVSIQIRKDGEYVACFIEDDGVGFNAEILQGAHPGIGLRGIQERLNALGGSLRVMSVEGRGTRLEISAPLLEVEHDNTSATCR